MMIAELKPKYTLVDLGKIKSTHWNLSECDAWCLGDISGHLLWFWFGLTI